MTKLVMADVSLQRAAVIAFMPAVSFRSTDVSALIALAVDAV
jgi:hypothetical protein